MVHVARASLSLPDPSPSIQNDFYILDGPIRVERSHCHSLRAVFETLRNFDAASVSKRPPKKRCQRLEARCQRLEARFQRHFSRFKT